MRVLVQWTRRNPRDWEELDSADWASLPERPIPAPGKLGGKDDQPGWILAVCVQGVIFSGHDHYSVEEIPDGCRVTIWDDDPEDVLPTPWIAARWTFLDPAPDSRYEGQVNTRQWVEYWHVEDVPGAASGGPHRTHHPSTFVAPDHARHGIWVSQQKLDQHNAARSHRGWQEWIR